MDQLDSPAGKAMVKIKLLTLCILGNYSCFYGCLWTYFKINLFKKSFRNTIRVSNGLDLDQDQCSVALIWIQTVCKGYKQTTKVALSKKIVKCLRDYPTWSDEPVQLI